MGREGCVRERRSRCSRLLPPSSASALAPASNPSTRRAFTITSRCTAIRRSRAVDCRRKPYHRDSARLVNYYGPAPGKYDPPDPREESPLRPPPKVTAAYRDAEPVVGTAPATAATR